MSRGIADWQLARVKVGSVQRAGLLKKLGNKAERWSQQPKTIMSTSWERVYHETARSKIKLDVE